MKKGPMKKAYQTRTRTIKKGQMKHELSKVTEIGRSIVDLDPFSLPRCGFGYKTLLRSIVDLDPFLYPDVDLDTKHC